MFMRYLGGGVGHLIHRQSGWQGNDDADVNGLPDDDDMEDPGIQSVADDPVEIPLNLPDVDMPSQEEDVGEDSEMDEDELDDDDEPDDSGSEGEHDGELEVDGDGELDGDDESDEDGDLFDDEGYLDI